MNGRSYEAQNTFGISCMVTHCHHYFQPFVQSFSFGIYFLPYMNLQKHQNFSENGYWIQSFFLQSEHIYFLHALQKDIFDINENLRISYCLENISFHNSIFHLSPPGAHRAIDKLEFLF